METIIEQQLINAFMKLSAKAGNGWLIRDLVRNVDANGNPKSWTNEEMHHAVSFLNQHIDNFAKEDATRTIRTLMEKFDIDHNDLMSPSNEMPETTGVKGLQ